MSCPHQELFSCEDCIKESVRKNYDPSKPNIFERFRTLESNHQKLRQAAEALRTAQKNYMANRGNQELGKQVAVMAKELDKVLEETKE